MIDIKKIEDIAEQIRHVLPQGAEELRHEIKANVRVILEAAFARMDLVTREEFDAQMALLARTRAKLEELEQAVARLETQGGHGAGAEPNPAAETNKGSTKGPIGD